VVLDDAGISKDRQVLGDSGDVVADNFSQFAHAPFTLGQFLDNAEPGGMGHSFDNGSASLEAGAVIGSHGASSIQLFGKIAK
jgi:hypothetical protein